MAKLYRAAFVVLCITSLFSVLALAGEGPAANPDTGIQVPLFIPAPESKLPPDGCRNYCLGDFSTSVNGGASDWGMGSSCYEAQAALDSAVSNRAENNCISSGNLWACSVTTVNTSSCFFNGTMFQVDGYANYKCMVEVCP